MYDPGEVRQFERPGDLRADGDDVIDGRLLGDEMPHGEPFDQLHHDERAVGRLANVVHGDNVGVVQRGGRLRLAGQPVDRLFVFAAAAAIRQHFNRDVSGEQVIVRAIDDAVAAAADAVADPIPSDQGVACHGHDSIDVVDRRRSMAVVGIDRHHVDNRRSYIFGSVTPRCA